MYILKLAIIIFRRKQDHPGLASRGIYFYRRKSLSATRESRLDLAGELAALLVGLANRVTPRVFEV